MNLLQPVRSLWKRLSKPLVKLPPDEYTYAQMVASLLALALPFFFLLELAGLISGSVAAPLLTVVFIEYGAWFVVYWLARYGRFREGVFIGLVATSVSSAVRISLANDWTSAYVTVLIVVFSSLFLAVRYSVFFLALNLALLLILQMGDSGLPEQQGAVILTFLLISGGAFIVLNAWQRQLEKRRQSDLAISRERYRRLVEDAPISILIHILGGGIAYINPMGLRTLGLDSDTTLHSRSPLELIDVRDHAKAQDLIKRTVDTGEAQTGQLTMARSVGRHMLIEVTAVPMIYEGVPAIQVIAQDVTERDRLTFALQRSEKRNRAFIDALPDLTMRIDRDGTLLDFKGAEFGPQLVSDGGIGKHVSQSLVPELASFAQISVQKELLTGEIVAGEIAVSEAAYEVRVTSSDENEFVLIVRDITDRKRSQEAIESLALFPAQNPFPVLRMGADGTIQYANDAAEPLLQRWKSYIGSTVPPDWQAIINNVLKYDTMEVSNLEFDGRSFALDFIPVVDSGYVNVYGHDITLFKHAQIALSKSEQDYRTLLENIPMGVYRTTPGPKGRFLVANNALVKLLGFPSMEALLATPTSAVYLNPADRLQFSKQVMSEGFVSDYEVQLKGYDGRELWGTVDARLVDQGAHTYFDCVMMDVTERKNAVQAIHRRDEILSALADAGEQMLKSLDLDTVLPSVIGRIGEAASVCHVHVFENELIGDTLQPVSFYMWKNPLSRHAGDDPIELPALEGEPSVLPGEGLFVGNMLDVPENWQAELTRHEVKSFAAVPVMCGDNWWGILAFDDRDQERVWLESEIEALRSIAAMVGAAVARKQVEASEKEQRALAEALRDSVGALSSTLDPGEVAERVLSSMQHVVPSDGSAILLIEKDFARVTHVRGMHAEDRDAVEMQRFPVMDAPNLRQMIETHQPVYVADTDAYEGWIDTPNARWIKSHLGAPIVVDGEVIGFLNVDSRTPNAFTEDHVDRLQAFTAQAAIAIRNAQVFITEKEQRVLSERLRDTAAVLNRSLDLDEVLDHILSQIRLVVPHDTASIMLLGANDRVARIVRHQGFVERGIENVVENVEFDVDAAPKFSEMLRSGAPVLYADAHVEPEWLPVEGTEWIKSHISVPVRADTDLIGIINVDSTQVGFFTEEHVRRLVLFADPAAIAIQNARLHAELVQRADEVALLYRSMASIFAGLSPSATVAEACQRVVEVVVRDFSHHDCRVLLVDPDSRMLKSIGVQSVRSSEMRRDLDIDGPGLVALAARTGQPVYLADVQQDARYYMGDPATQSELSIPLSTSRGTIGVLDLQSDKLDDFSQRDQRILEAFADRAAVVIENRQLYAEVRTYTGELEQRVIERTIDLTVRNAVAETLSSSLDIPEMLRGVLVTSIEQLGVMGGAIYLLNSDSLAMHMVASHGVPAKSLNLVTGFDVDPGEEVVEASSILTQVSLDEIRDKTGISAVLSIPILHQEQVQGIITLVHGEPRPWSNEETSMLDAIGRQIGVALANARMYEDALRDEAQVRAILTGVADGLLVFDEDGELILMNPAAEALFGFYPDAYGGPRQAVILFWNWLHYRHSLGNEGQGIEFTLPEHHLSEQDQEYLLGPCRENGCPNTESPDPEWPCWLRGCRLSQVEMFHCPVHERISRRSIQAQSTPIRDGERGRLGTVIALHDVSYYRELDELKGRFVSTVSHELRTPLSAVLLQVSTLLKYYDRFEETERRQMITEVHGQAQVLRELIEDILELSRYDAKRSVMQTRWFNLADACASAVAAMHPVIEEKKLTFTMDGCESDLYIMGDPNHMARAIRNLLSNAIKYTPSDGSVSVSVQRENDLVKIAVTDSGIGMDAETQAHVFDRFYRADDAAQMASGTGLGLAITKEIVTQHGGSIAVESTLGKGSTFTVHLPVAIGDAIEWGVKS